MNERIRELARQTGIIDVELLNDSQGKMLEKFAELIIRECARAVDKVYEDAEPDHGCYDWATFAEGADVLKHFGVEEWRSQ